MSLLPVHIGSSSGLRKGVEALPASVASLALLPDLKATREGGGSRWGLSLPGRRRSVRKVQRLCAVFDRPGLPSGLVGEVGLTIAPPAPGALGTYLGQCAEVAGRLRGSGAGALESGLKLSLEVDDSGQAAGGGGVAGGADGGRFLGHVLGAVLPAAAPHVRHLVLLLETGVFQPGFSTHLAAPGLAFPLLEVFALHGGSGGGRSIAAVDVAGLAQLVAPRLGRIELPSGSIVGGTGARCAEAAIRALAMGLTRPVDAAGRPGSLQVSTGRIIHCSMQDVRRCLSAAGRDWVHLAWPSWSPSDPSSEDSSEESD